jgi:hypothetical protein
MVDYYELLRINRNASTDEIRKAYRQLAVLLHPDKNPHPDAAEGFRAITEAYQVLSDEIQRKDYDAGLELGKLIQQKGSAFRDPAYRRAAHQPSFRRPDSKISPKDFMRSLMPLSRWINRLCVLICLLGLIDFLSPSKYVNEMISTDEGTIQQTFRSVREHNLQTESGHEFSVAYPDIIPFRKEPEITVEISGMFNLVKHIQTKSGKFELSSIASVYGTFSFAPLILLLLTLTGFFVRESDEFSFSIAVVSLLFIFLNIFFFVLSIW